MLIDFTSFNKDKHRYNNVLVVIDRLLKELILILYYKTTTAKDIASLFIYYIWRYFGPPNLIMSDQGP